jgi:2-iminobutanoate/2-iminopropanoate deaminase
MSERNERAQRDTEPKVRAKRIRSTEYGHPVETFTQACEVPAGGSVIFFSGITARDANATVVGAGDIERQCRQVFDNIKKILSAAGATAEDVVKTNAYVTRSEYMEVYRRIKEEYFGKLGPPGTVVQVVALYDPLQLIEIEAIAVVQKPVC